MTYAQPQFSTAPSLACGTVTLLQAQLCEVANYCNPTLDTPNVLQKVALEKEVLVCL